MAAFIISLFPDHHTYVELFGGSAAVLLQKPVSRVEIYNELDGEVVNYFRILRDPQLAVEFARRIHLTPFARGEFEAAKPRGGDDDVERARKLAVRSFMGFSGSEAMYRADDENAFRTACAASGAGNCIAKAWAGWHEALDGLTARLRGVNIERMPALEAIAKYDNANTLFYADPPYVHSSRHGTGVKRNIYAHEMDEAAHAALAEALRGAAGFVVLSGYEGPLYEDLYAGWRKHCKMSKTNTKTRKLETVWTNARCEAARPQGLLL